MKTKTLVCAVAGAAFFALPATTAVTTGGQGQFIRAAMAQAYDRDVVREIQEHLNTLGYKPGPADGAMGWNTRQAIKSYQQDSGFSVDGEPTRVLLNQLRGSVGGASSADVRKLANEIQKKIADAERRGRAEPSFLTELRGVIGPYIEPVTRRLLSDNFGDGNYTANPEWKVVGGTFTVENNILTSTVEGDTSGRNRDVDAEDMAVSIIGGLLGVDTGRGAASGPEPAAIYTEADIGGEFELEARLQADEGSTCELGLYADKDHKTAYVLTMAPGEAPRLTRRESGRYYVLGTANGVLDNSDTRWFDVTWNRADNGKMTITVDKDNAIATTDVSLGDRFLGLEYVNRIGTCKIRWVRVSGKAR